MKTAIIVFAHGSSVPSANDAVRAVTAQLAAAGGYNVVDTAFLESARPDLGESVAALAAQGATDILVLPYFLTLGIHLRRDLPRIVGELSRIHRGVRIQVGEPLDGHPALAQILLERAQQALDARPVS